MLRRVLALIVISVLALPSVSADCATLLGQAGSTWIPVNPVMPSPGITFSSSAPKHVSYDGNVVLTSAGVDAAWDSDPCAGATEPPGASSFGQVAWGFEPSPSTGASITPLGNGVQITPPDVGSAQVWSCCASMPSKRDATFFNIGSCWPKGKFMCFTMSLGATSGGGDPVFFTFHSRTKYHWHGEPGKVFAILGDRYFQFNALLVPNLIYGNGAGTWMYSFGLRAHNASLVVHANRTVSINRGYPLPYNQLKEADFVSLYPTFREFTLKKNSFELQVPNWGLEIKFRTFRKENKTQEHLDFTLEDMHPQDEVPLVHGVLGQTYMTNGEPLKKCNKKSQGGCFVSGSPFEYFINGNDLLGTEWPHSHFLANETLLATRNFKSSAPVHASSESG